MTSPIQVLVRNVPRLVRDVIEHAIMSEPDMELLHDHEGDRRTELTSGGPDVVIIGSKAGLGHDTEETVSTLWRWPRTPVLVITHDAHESALCELQLSCTELGEPSPNGIVDAIHAAVRRREPSTREGS